MALANEDISFIKQHLSEWIAEESLGKPLVVFEIELRERIVRVEEELKHQRTLIQQILHQMDKRFDAAEKAREQLREDMLDRFARVDKRFEQIDKRFEQVDNRFDEIIHRLDRFMFWSLGLTVTAAVFVVKYLS